jgi:hypothetical protein
MAAKSHDELLELLNQIDTPKGFSEASSPDAKLWLAQLLDEDEAKYQGQLDKWRGDGVTARKLDTLDKAVRKTLREKRQARRIDRQDGFRRDARGNIIPNGDNVRTALDKMGVRLSYDVFRGWPQVEGLGDGYGPTVDDHAMNRMWLAVDEQFGFQPSLSTFQIFVQDGCYQNRFHPVLDYLDGLKWDGVPRIDTWLIDYAHASDTPYARAVGALVMVAAVRRVREPGAKFDELLILESEQGHSKSEMIEALAVKEDWYSDSVRLNVDDKQMIESSSGIWIAEFGELQGMRKGEVEKIKAQLSRRSDRARLAYGRLPTVVPRQSVGIGSTNGGKNDQYLADITGNRRFWPVEVSRCDVKGVVRDRDQLWAEAAAREAAGASIRLPEALWPAAQREQQARAVNNAFVDVLSVALGNMEGVIFADDGWKLLKIPVERRDANARKFGQAWALMGWSYRNRRRNGAQAGAYIKGDSERLITVTEDAWDRELHVKYGPESRKAR